ACLGFLFWTHCSVTCGRGGQQRGRSCNGISGCAGPSLQTRSCSLIKCDRKGRTSVSTSTYGNWGLWSPWSACTTTCGEGNITRIRLCNNPPPSKGGKGCTGNTRETKPCNNTLCPADGNWGLWSPWSACTTTCGEGNITRIRLCNNPPPSKGGKGCTGNTRETKPCNNTLCPVTGGWTAWNEWSQCSTSCGCIFLCVLPKRFIIVFTFTSISDLCVLSNPCFPGVKCTSKIDGSWECGHCPVGLKGNGTHCEDENEVKGEEERLDYLKWDLIDFVYIFK
uniref:Uncharacterized protein n=1 Tax=Cyprinodon variegatus TaxID=28743 RepID=A0A3Q2CI69_CYPVA